MKTFAYPAILLFLFLFGCSTNRPTGDETAVNAIENGLLTGIQVEGQEPKLYSLAERMAYFKVPGVSIAIVKDGQISWAKGYGTANTETGTLVDENTLFQAGSISKPLAALAALKLVEEGKVSLDEDVNTYLTDWKVADNQHTATEKVTLRRLLTHTAGMTVHGFPGYHQTFIFPAIKMVLNGKGNTPPIVVDTIPGSIWRYSGGGYTVMEKLVEDVTGLPLAKYADENILQPMGMENSTFAQPLPTKLHASASAAYDRDGTLIGGQWHNYPEQAAAGLWTTPTDLARYCIEIQSIYTGKKQNGLLSKETVDQMLTKHKNDWGLGPSLKWDGDSLIFQHGGKNAGFTNNMVAFANRGDAVIIMTNADNGGRLIGEIMNAVSAYYDWGLGSTKTISLINLSADELQRFVGKYQYEGRVPGVAGYFVDIKLVDGQLMVFDTVEEESFSIIPMEPLKFIDIEKGDEIAFSENGETSSLSFMWNNNFRFVKVEESGE